MSVPRGTLTSEFRAALLDFYSDLFGWRELESLSNPDRLTIAIGRTAYINVRERDSPMAPDAYEHFGVLVASVEDVHALHSKATRLGAVASPVEEPVDGHPTFRLEHLLPMAIEVQFIPEHLQDEPA
jgi:hypothetical protein